VGPEPPPCLVWTSSPSHSPQIDTTVLDFPIFPAFANGGLKVSILGPQIGENRGVLSLDF